MEPASFVTGNELEDYLVSPAAEASSWTVTLVGVAGTEVPAPRLAAGIWLHSGRKLQAGETGWLVDSYLLPDLEDGREVVVAIPGREPIRLVHPDEEIARRIAAASRRD